MRPVHRVNMTGSQLLQNILLFSYPLMISNLCQMLFNAADTLIVGRFSGTAAMAAVGATSPILQLLTWGLSGFSIGADVVVSRLFGASDRENIQKSVHTAYFLASVCGAATAVIGILVSVPLLRLMATPEDIIADSAFYLRIYFCGLFFIVVYNFGAACLRSGGDTRRPTLFMISSGVMNVALNLLFVCGFGMSVAGVALATVISQLFSAVMVTVSLMREQGSLHLSLARIRPEASLAKQMVTIGLPSMLQNMCFSVSNMVVQSSINSFGTAAVAGNSAGSTIENLVYVTTSAVTQACITFTGQNNGADNRKNMLKVLGLCLMLQAGLGFTIGTLLNLNGSFAVGLFASDEAVIASGILRLRYVAWWLFLNGIADVFTGTMRAVGYSLLPASMTLLGICGIRIGYICLILPHYRTLGMLYLCYPVSWLVTIIILMVMWYAVLGRKLLKP